LLSTDTTAIQARSTPKDKQLLRETSGLAWRAEFCRLGVEALGLQAVAIISFISQTARTARRWAFIASGCRRLLRDMLLWLKRLGVDEQFKSMVGATASAMSGVHLLGSRWRVQLGLRFPSSASISATVGKLPFIMGSVGLSTGFVQGLQTARANS
jgi:hypothetical protein